jgi:NAD-dependent dihydropyrimidine dehydrogenase PreA subunit
MPIRGFMKRKIIRIDEEKCTGCGLCVNACHEGAIGMVDGKAKLLRDDYCDGLGDCLPACPVNAISFEEREATPYNEAAVQKIESEKHVVRVSPGNDLTQTKRKQWPLQIKLAPVKAAYFENADLLIAADCTAYAYAAFHDDFMKDKTVIIGCPKLDNIDYSEKIYEIITNNNIKSITIAIMSVPCCKGTERAVQTALAKSGKKITHSTTVIGIDGKIVA